MAHKPITQSKRVCVIGAGPSGIAAARNCVEFGIDVVVFERGDKVGGNWVFNATSGHSSVYDNTHNISSKAWSEYEDFPMPAGYPEYPRHDQLQSYFESYAKHFSVYEHIRFRHTVTHVTREADGRWRVQYLDDKQSEHGDTFDALMVANGHHWDPRYPEYPGKFTGKFMHSHDFKRATDDWRGKRVLVIGAGNSACDVAVETARLASKVCLSMRRPQWFLPKFLFGVPVDVYAARFGWVPTRLRQRLFGITLKLLQGSYKNYGLPAPTRPAGTQHPTLNSDLLDFIRHGRVKPCPAVKALHGDDVEFDDGTREAFDIICACTGFWISFPFFDKSFVDFRNAERVPLYRLMMHAQYPNLYFIGLFQPLGCIWPLADYQAKLACAEIVGRYHRPDDMQAAIQREVAHPHTDFERTARHSTEVDYHAFRRELREELKKADIDIGEPPRGRKGHYKNWGASDTEGAIEPHSASSQATG
jgi:hypothetical protein